MSDRTFNAVYISIYDEDWSDCCFLVAMIILTKCPNQYGIYKMPWKTIKERFIKHISTEDMLQGLEELKQDGMIKTYDDDNLVWIVKKWSTNPHYQVRNNHVGAIRWVAENHPNILREFESVYNGGTESQPSTDTVPTESKQNNSKPKPKTKTVEPHDPELVTIVQEILPGLSDSQLGKQVDALDKLIRLDIKKVDNSYNPDAWRAEVIAVIRWMRADTEPSGGFPGWSAVFHSISRLRENNCQKFRNARGQYLTSRKPKKQAHQQPEYEL